MVVLPWLPTNYQYMFGYTILISTSKFFGIVTIDVDYDTHAFTYKPIQINK